VQRMHEKFLRKQGQLSVRLQRRVKRLQLDFRELYDTKVETILPSDVTGVRDRDENAGNHSNEQHESVLRYLRRHRHHVERERQSQHSVYMDQVDKFQFYLRHCGDPHRTPERGEVYLSECFKHVLAAGLLVDSTYFFRVLQNLQTEDYEKVFTVNMLAACCDAFGIDVQQYRVYIEKRGLPLFALEPCPGQVRTWEDVAPWHGVKLRSWSSADRSDTKSRTLTSSLQSLEREYPLQEDPLPFCPVVPDEMPSVPEMMSRDDPVAEILDKIALDMVLERYLQRSDSRSPSESPRGSASQMSSRTHVLISDGQRTGGFEGKDKVSSASSASSAWTLSLPPPTRPAIAPCTPPTSTRVPDSRRLTRPVVRQPTLLPPRNTLHKAAMLATPISEVPGAPPKDRPRTANQPPPMNPIAETRSPTELLS